MKVLSGGEKSRLALVKLLLAPPNFLLLDEPTTHLDMSSIDALIHALEAYTGTIVFVSHDVHFIRAIADRTVHINAGRLTHYSGGYDYYLQKSGASSEQAALVAGLNNARPENNESTPVSRDKMSAKERRRQEAEARKIAIKERRTAEKQVNQLENEIMDLEEEQVTLSKQLEDPTTYNDAEAAKSVNLRAAEVAQLITEKTEAWEHAAEALSTLQEG